VLAGRLPPGAVGVVGVDWELVVANGYWICKTSLRTLRREPEIACSASDQRCRPTWHPSTSIALLLAP
jgi:hypothetical protein